LTISIVALAAVAVAVAFGVPAIRKKIFPRRDRATFGKK